jgi:NAD-dependent oxidoreductase involved in siderophore biosynthesis
MVKTHCIEVYIECKMNILISQLVLSLCRNTESSFPDRDTNLMAVASNDVSVTWPARQTMLVSHGPVLFVHAEVSTAQADGNSQAIS